MNYFFFLLLFFSTLCGARSSIELSKATVFTEEKILKLADIITFKDELATQDEMKQIALSLNTHKNVFSRNDVAQLITAKTGKMVDVRGWPKIIVWRCSKNIHNQIIHHLEKSLFEKAQQFQIQLKDIEVPGLERLCISDDEQITSVVKLGQGTWRRNNAIEIRLDSGKIIKSSLSLSFSQPSLVARSFLKKGTKLSPEYFEFENQTTSVFAPLYQPDWTKPAELKYAMKQGRRLKKSSVKTIHTINKGQRVTLVHKGNGFVLQAEAQALSDANVGEELIVKLRDGNSTVEAIVKNNKEVHVL